MMNSYEKLFGKPISQNRVRYATVVEVQYTKA